MSDEEMAEALAILGYTYADIATYVINHDLESIMDGIKAIYNSLPQWA